MALGEMIAAIESFITDTLGARLGVLLCSMIPIIELRGGIPLGMALGLAWWQSFLFAVIGNMLPVPFILLFINRLIAWMAESRIGFLNKMGSWLLLRARQNRGKIEKYSFFGVCLFVAVPLPATGAWTGSLAAAVLGLKFWRALFSCFFGVLLAATVVTLISYGTLAALGFLL